ncbi:MAG: phospho-sugar mutase, partial [Nonlabens sp.]|nr:phospho-sugar mutase [Nonlabens sp.]
VTAALLACEWYAFAKANNATAYSQLIDLYVKHGCYQEKLVSLVKKGIAGAEEINQMMRDLRAQPPKQIAGQNVVLIEDYKTGERTNKDLGTTEKMDIPSANVLIFYLQDGTKIAARPSGTEPKIKFYISAKAPLDKPENYGKVQDALNLKIEQILTDLQIS